LRRCNADAQAFQSAIEKRQAPGITELPIIGFIFTGYDYFPSKNFLPIFLIRFRFNTLYIFVKTVIRCTNQAISRKMSFMNAVIRCIFVLTALAVGSSCTHKKPTQQISDTPHPGMHKIIAAGTWFMQGADDTLLAWSVKTPG
jgi:hypothetical protein